MSDDLVKRLRETTHMYQVDCELKMKCADLIEELEAKLDWMIVKLDWVIAERDETFALMLDRAQTAEAKLAKQEALMDAGFAEYERRLEKAVEALATIMCNCVGDAERCGSKAAIAELTGGKDE